MGTASRSPSPLVHLLLALCLVAFTAPGLAQEAPAGQSAEGEAAETAPKALLALEEVIVRGPVEGEAPGADTLARLSVRIANRGEAIASSLAFTVEVAEQELPVYVNQVFLKPIPPGVTVELALYNFWTGETGRPAPADGKLSVEVSLREAKWMERTVEQVEGEPPVEVWTPTGAVEGLPVTASTVVTLKK
jgi:hypothetical protein